MSSNPQSLAGTVRFYAIGLIIMCLFANRSGAQSSYRQVRPRIVVTADPELDDNNSLISFLLYSCDMQIEGLIYASSGYHWKGDGKGTKWFVPGREYTRFGLDTCPCLSWRLSKNERFINDAVEAYEKVYPNLKMHNSNYPAPDELKKMGYVVWMPVQPKGSWLGEGDDHTFMNMLGNGLRAYEAGFYGGWGGREGQLNKSAKEVAYPDLFPQVQHDFAALHSQVIRG